MDERRRRRAGKASLLALALGALALPATGCQGAGGQNLSAMVGPLTKVLQVALRATQGGGLPGGGLNTANAAGNLPTFQPFPNAPASPPSITGNAGVLGNGTVPSADTGDARARLAQLEEEIRRAEAAAGASNCGAECIRAREGLPGLQKRRDELRQELGLS